MERKISVVINTYNASAHLAEVLESVVGFDEVVVCDMESDDETCAIARKYGCKIVVFSRGDHKICEPARDFAIHSASNLWVLVVDADEIVPPALRDYLYECISSPDFDNALAIARINLFMGQPVKGAPDYQLRFFRQDKAVWPPVIHARPKIEGVVTNAPNRRELSLWHLDDPTVAQLITKMNIYTDYEVPKRAHKHYGMWKMIMRPLWLFIKSYLLGRGIIEGKRGVVKAYMDSMYQMCILSKIFESQVGGKSNNQK